MSEILSICDLINLWPTRAALASDMTAASRPLLMVTPAQVHKWAEKNSIPSKYHHTLLLAGAHRGFEITADLIVRLHSCARDAA